VQKRCICQAGFYSTSSTDATACSPCPDGAVCNAADLNATTIQSAEASIQICALAYVDLRGSQGYWRSANSSVEFLRCLSVENVCVSCSSCLASFCFLCFSSAREEVSLSSAALIGWVLCANFVR
jgi:hypothetical protein